MRRNVSLVFVLLTLLALLVAACAPTDPIARVDYVRAQYTVQLNSWLPQAPEPPPVEPLPVEVDETATEGAEATDEAVASAAAAAEEAAEEAAEGEADGETEPIETGPATTAILFDLLVNFQGDEALPGITVEVTHAGADEQEKDVRLQYIETPGIVKGATKQVDFVLEGFAYEDGDLFSVDLATSVPADARGNYPEYADALANSDG
ncbi:MAG: hypothetical protein AAF772_17700 [Acidobacteriota bacterium]